MLDPFFEEDHKYFQATVRVYEDGIRDELRRAPRNNPEAIRILSRERDRIKRVLARMEAHGNPPADHTG